MDSVVTEVAVSKIETATPKKTTRKKVVDPCDGCKFAPHAEKKQACLTCVKR